MTTFGKGSWIVVALTALGCGEAATDGSTGAANSSSGASSSGSGAAQGSGGAGTATSTGPGAGGGSTGAGGRGPADVCPGGPYADDPLPADPTASMVQGGFDFLEGPVWFADPGVLFFSDMHFGAPNAAPLNGPQSTMHRFTPPSTFEAFIDNSSTNGLGVDLGGQIIACTHDTRSVSRFDLATKARSNIADAYMGNKLNSPNDVVVRSDGHVYFTDPDWQLSGTSELPMAAYHVSPGGAVALVDLLNKPNGVTLSPDEKTLYVGAIDGQIRAYALADDGSTGPASDFAQVPGPDGMGRDCAGNLYVASGGGVVVLAPDGAQIGVIGGMSGTTNAAFGGADRKTLFVTAGAALYSIDLAIPGYPY